MKTIQHSFQRSDGTYMVIRTTTGDGSTTLVELVIAPAKPVEMEASE